MHHKQARSGPHPLWLHLNGGAAMMAAASEEANMFAASQDILSQTLAGVQAYHYSPVKPFRREMHIVAEVAGSQLLAMKDTKQDEVVILIPSLINGWEIFDIEEQHSFIAFLESQGITPYVLNWAEPVDDISINDYIAHHCIPLIQLILDRGIKIKGVIGYCMGATMIAALYSAFNDIMQKIDRAIMIAPPWDFSYQTVDQMVRLQSLAVQTYAMGNVVPNDFVQSLFWAVDPLQVLKKFRKFPDVQNPERFVRVEDWLNAGRAVSKSVVQTCLFDWYRDNKIMSGEWSCNDIAVNQNLLPDRTLIIAGEKDTLVPMASIKPLTDDRKLICVDTGHIGLMASDKSIEKCWLPIAEFLKQDTV